MDRFAIIQTETSYWKTASHATQHGKYATECVSCCWRQKRENGRSWCTGSFEANCLCLWQASCWHRKYTELNCKWVIYCVSPLNTLSITSETFVTVKHVPNACQNNEGMELKRSNILSADSCPQVQKKWYTCASIPSEKIKLYFFIQISDPEYMFSHLQLRLEKVDEAFASCIQCLLHER